MNQGIKTLRNTLLFCILFAVVVSGLLVIAGCGHEASREAKFQTEDLTVATRSKGSSTNAASTNTKISITVEQDGTKVFTYSSDTATDSTTAHKPAETIEAVGDAVEKATPGIGDLAEILTE